MSENCQDGKAALLFYVGDQLLYAAILVDTRRVHVCLAVICYLQFWQNEGGLLCAAEEYAQKVNLRKEQKEKETKFFCQRSNPQPF